MKCIVICDADILIDYGCSNKKILQLVTQNLYEIWVPLPVWEEVKDLSEKDAENLGLRIVEPTLEAVIEASSMHGGSLSDEDNICFIIARDEKAICATNDKHLREKCERHSIRVIWGLEMMVQLYDLGKLSQEIAESTARKISENNPAITKEIIEKFLKLIR